ncbi:MAG: glutathione ABC transporter substrate-binding protein [Limnochordaceae bacterium]|nr:glutathione ABC transporter substrate-binding protein [Limnochordaceae bacterium]
MAAQRSRPKLKGLSFLLAIVATLTVAGWGAASPATVTVAVGADAVRLDPPDMTDNPSETVLRHIMDGLVEFDEQLQIRPALAERWEFQNGGKDVVFYLRKGVRFHDGTPFDAAAVKANFDRILAGGLRRTSLYEPYIQSVEAKDTYTVVFHLKFPFGAFLHHLAHGAGLIQSPSNIRRWGDKVGQHPVGTGPFKFVEWVPGDHITLEANKQYWKGAPKFDRLVFRVVPEDATRVFQLETGEADVITFLPPSEVPRLRANRDLDIRVADSLRVIYVGFNVLRKPFDDVRVRQAVNYAIDKELIVSQVLGGMASVSDSPMAPGVNGYCKTGGYPYDPERARQLLKEAGYPQGLEVSLWAPQGRYLKDYETAIAIQAMLQQVGIRVRLQTMEWATYLRNIFDVPKEQAQYQMYMLGWAPSTGDADWVMRPLLSSQSFPPGDNASYYGNPKVDQLIQEGMRTSDPDARARIYCEAQKQVVADAPWAFLHVVKQVVGVRASLQGVKVLPIEIVLVKDASKK